MTTGEKTPDELDAAVLRELLKRKGHRVTLRVLVRETGAALHRDVHNSLDRLYAAGRIDNKGRAL